MIGYSTNRFLTKAAKYWRQLPPGRVPASKMIGLALGAGVTAYSFYHRQKPAFKTIQGDELFLVPLGDASASFHDRRALGLVVSERMISFKETFAGSQSILLNEFDRNDRDHLWIQSDGLLSTKRETQGEAPLDISIAGSIDRSHVVRFRWQRPQGSKGQVPFLAKDAALLSPGTQLEISGELMSKKELMASYGCFMGSGPFGPSEQVSIEAEKEVSREVIVRIVALRDPGEVKVFVTNSVSSEEGLRAKLVAALKSDSSLVVGEVDILEGLLELGLGETLYQVFEDYRTIESWYEASVCEEQRRGYSFNLDLNQDKHRDVYSKLVNFSIEEALTQLQSLSTNIKEKHQSMSAEQQKAEVSLGPYEFSWGTREATMKTKIDLRDKTLRVLHRHCFSRSFHNYFLGHKKVTWEAVSIDQGCDRSEILFHFSVFAFEKSLNHEKLADYLKLAHILNMNPHGVVRQPAAERFVRGSLHRASGTELSLDLYVNEDGIKLLDDCDPEVALRLYFESCETFGDDIGALKNLTTTQTLQIRDIMSKLDDYRCSAAYFDLGLSIPISLLSDYRHLTGRSLTCDEVILTNAISFCHHLKGLDMKTGEDQASRFFTEFGESQGFRFLRALGAMATIAGHENILVNKLCMQGAGAKLEALSEPLPKGLAQQSTGS